MQIIRSGARQPRSKRSRKCSYLRDSWVGLSDLTDKAVPSWGNQEKMFVENPLSSRWTICGRRARSYGTSTRCSKGEMRLRFVLILPVVSKDKLFKAMEVYESLFHLQIWVRLLWSRMAMRSITIDWSGRRGRMTLDGPLGC